MRFEGRSGAQDRLDEALLRLRRTLSDQITEQTAFDVPRNSIRTVVAIAHETDMLPERVVIEMKQMLRSLPGLDRMTFTDREIMHSNIVRFTIDAYFGDEH